MKNILIAVVGPTAIGKTTLSIALATYFKTEIISADSRQFYKEMSIGTAVPSAEELQSAPHHFIQHKHIFESYSVGDFEKEAIHKLDQLFKKHAVVVMVGGSGLYINAVTKGLDTFPSIRANVREELNEQWKEEGIEALQQQLQVLDEQYYKKVDLNNPHRLIRALEVCISSGKPYSSFLNQASSIRNFHTITIGIQADRTVLYDRINRRVDQMIAEGLVDEAKKIQEHASLNALQTVGYKELFNYFKGEWTLDFAVSEIKKNTRRFAKRQLTWFKRNTETLWIEHLTSSTDIITLVQEHIDQLQKQKH